MLWFLVVLSAWTAVMGLDNGLGLTPQMGWNSWNHFTCHINQTLIKRTADLLVQTGLAAKGYKYVNLDDCWQIARNLTTKKIIEDPEAFPSGIKSLSDYVHSKGLLFGLYSDAGFKTCAGRPGSYGFEKIDAQQYAEWQVDYLKYDNCNNLGISDKLRYSTMQKALNKSGRYIFYSMCNWGEEKPWQWAAPIANSWRTTGDISNHWNSFLSILDKQVGLEKYASEGAWNDPDMLEVGNGGMTFQEQYAHFAFWALLKAPLLIGCSLQGVSNRTLEILGNEQLIAINQDSLKVQGRRLIKTVTETSHTEIWGGPLSGNRWAFIFLNRGIIPSTVSLNITETTGVDFTNYHLTDIIKHKDEGIRTDDTLSSYLLPRGFSAYTAKFKLKQHLVSQ